jgi:hypothetical protein
VQFLVENGADVRVGIEAATEHEQPKILAWLEGFQKSKKERAQLLAITDSPTPKKSTRRI